MINLPWLTEGAIAFLESYLTPDMRVLEFGAGASTLWFADRVQELVSIEGNDAWYHQTVKEVCGSKSSVTLILHKGYEGPQRDYPDEHFDFILVDGRNRVSCFLHSDRVLKQGGYIMLDNSERPRYAPCFAAYQNYPNTSDTQTKPDALGFWYHNWTTTWWQKCKT